MALVTGGGILRLKSLATRPHAAPAPADGVAVAPACDYSRMPDLAWVGWIGAGAGVVVFSVVRGLFPVRAVNWLHLSASTLGTLFFAASLAQALTGLALMRSRFWMYRPAPVAAFGAVGLAGILGFGLAQGLPGLTLSAIAFGTYSGAFFFYLVFHALTHPRRSAQYVAINEAVVGLGGIVGPVLGGLLADAYGVSLPYVAGAVVVVTATAWQVQMHRRYLIPAGLASR